jgi:Fe2+ or Zn2+ uptake regulation protein
MGNEGQNAILKILEEPPSYINFILLCSSKSGFLPTVLSRATVYNNLASLVEERVLFKITGGGGKAIYDTTTLPHAHTVCTSCGHIEDLFLHSLDREIRGELGERLVDYDLTVRVLCTSCKS